MKDIGRGDDQGHNMSQYFVHAVTSSSGGKVVRLNCQSLNKCVFQSTFCDGEGKRPDFYLHSYIIHYFQCSLAFNLITWLFRTADA